MQARQSPSNYAGMPNGNQHMRSSGNFISPPPSHINQPAMHTPNGQSLFPTPNGRTLTQTPNGQVVIQTPDGRTLIQTPSSQPHMRPSADGLLTPGREAAAARVPPQATSPGAMHQPTAVYATQQPAHSSTNVMHAIQGPPGTAFGSNGMPNNMKNIGYLQQPAHGHPVGGLPAPNHPAMRTPNTVRWLRDANMMLLALFACIRCCNTSISSWCYASIGSASLCRPPFCFPRKNQLWKYRDRRRDLLPITSVPSRAFYFRDDCVEHSTPTSTFLLCTKSHRQGSEHTKEVHPAEP
jgi:hypothetical protein